MKDIKIKRNNSFVARTCVLILTMACLMLTVGGCMGKSTSPKTFSSDGMSITLTNEFREAEMEKFTVCYDSSKAAVFALKESFSLLEGFGDYTLAQYGEMVMKNNNLSSTEMKTTDELTYFEYEYTNTEENKVYKYYSFIYKANDAFWLIQFAINKGDAEKYFDDIVGWAKSVKFS